MNMTNIFITVFILTPLIKINYVLEEANLLGMYYSEEEALQAKEQHDN